MTDLGLTVRHGFLESQSRKRNVPQRLPGPDSHGFASRAYGAPGGAEAEGQCLTVPAWSSCGLKLTGGTGLDQRLQWGLVDRLEGRFDFHAKQSASP